MIDSNEGVLRIPQLSGITGISPSDCLVLYPEHSLKGSYSSAAVPSVYSTTQADWAIGCRNPAGKSSQYKDSPTIQCE